MHTHVFTHPIQSLQLAHSLPLEHSSLAFVCVRVRWSGGSHLTPTALKAALVERWCEFKSLSVAQAAVVDGACEHGAGL